MLTMNPFNTQTIGLAGATIFWGSIIQSNSTNGGIGALIYNAGSFINTSKSTLVLEVQYNLQWNQLISGFTYITANGVNYGYVQYNAQLAANSLIILLTPGKSFSIYCQNSSDGSVLKTNSTIVITSLSAGPIGPTGMTGFTGMGVTDSTVQAPFTIDAVVVGAGITTLKVAPTFIGVKIQQASYRLIGDKFRVGYQMGWAGGSDAGVGDYLISLPAGLSFNSIGLYNTTYSQFNFGQYNALYTGIIFPPDYSTIATAIIPALGGIVESSNWSTSSFVVPFSPTQFRLVIYYDGKLTTWNNITYGVNNGFLSLEFEIWKGG